MKTLYRLVTPVFLVLVFAVAALAGPITPTASAQIINNNSQREERAQESDETVSVTYSYTAQPGDSYSLIARKAIQTYGLKNDVSLSQAQIIFAETNLTQEAGSPQLNRGQTLEIKEASVKAWADKAKELSEEQQAAWAKYAQYANFNTDNVGQE